MTESLKWWRGKVALAYEDPISFLRDRWLDLRWSARKQWLALQGRRGCPLCGGCGRRLTNGYEYPCGHCDARGSVKKTGYFKTW